MTRVAYLCRGTGWAHAGRASLLLPGLRDSPAFTSVGLAASGVAVDYFALAGVDCHDLRVADELDHSGYAAHRIRRYLDTGPRPDVVLSDELCLAPVVCRAMGIPSVLMVCSFRHHREQPLGAPVFAAATRILLATWTEVDDIPEELRHKTRAIGPIVRRETQTRTAARAALGLPAAATVVTASFGNLHPSKRDWFRTALTGVIEAWRHAPHSALLAIPLSEPTVRQLTGLAPPPHVRCVGPTRHMNDYHVASDVVLTVGGSTTSHAVRNAIPTIVVAPPPDSVEQRNAAHLSATTPLVTVTTGRETPGQLLALIQHAAVGGHRPPDLPWGDVDDVVAALSGLSHLVS